MARGSCVLRYEGAGIERPIRTWHDLRHTALTHDAAAGNPAVYQARAGHAHATMTERYVHARRPGRAPALPSVRRSGCSRGSTTEAGTKTGTK